MDQYDKRQSVKGDGKMVREEGRKVLVRKSPATNRPTTATAVEG